LESNHRRILIIRTDRIGDIILTLPMARVLKIKFPSAHVSMLIQRYTSELVEDHRDVDEVLYYDENDRLIPFFKLVLILRRQKLDVVLHTHPRFRLALIIWLAGIPVRVGTGYRWYSFLFNNKVYEHRKHALHHELEYNLHLLEAIGCSSDGIDVKPSIDIHPAAANKVASLLENIGVTGNDRIVIIHPGSGKSARDWNAKNFGLLGKRISLFPNVKVIVTGGKSEKALVNRVCSLIGESSISLVNQLTLREYSALAKCAILFIANSTGPIHLAAAVGTPVIGFYPQVTVLNSTRWGPYTEKKIIFTPKDKPIDCKKCVRRKTDTCECMDSISIDDVYESAATIIRRSFSN